MKKQVVGLIIIIALSLGMLGGQASAATVHVVKAGDSLWSIARSNNVSVQDLLTWNELDSALIFPSQELKLQDDAKVYVVVKGDTLSEIAQSHDMSLSDLMKSNSISSDLIHPGDQLTLNETKGSSPQGKKSTAPTTPTQPAAKAPVPAPKPAPSSAKEMTVTATAYTAFCTGCSGTTYTGIDLRSNPNQKVIAVDPSVIPLGSRVWVEGYGEAVAGDIGGAIKGNIIDVFIENQQDALNWGRKKVTIKILD